VDVDKIQDVAPLIRDPGEHVAGKQRLRPHAGALQVDEILRQVDESAEFANLVAYMSRTVAAGLAGKNGDVGWRWW
jgi:hypothetical protein